MICEPCRATGYANKSKYFDRAAKLHEQCEFPVSCSCQHGTGSDWTVSKDVRGTS